MSINTAMTAIADAIRARTGGTDALSLADMPGAIGAIPDMKELLISVIERTVTEIDIPEGTTKLVYSCLSGCTNLTVVGIPSTVTSIGIHSFRNCSSLQSIDIPSSVTSIDTQAFNGSGITQITVHKVQDSISGAPWGATNATITWTEEQSND